MAKNTFIRGVTLSSTPIQSFEDSGYFGSDTKKTSKTKSFDACSPIKEYSFKTVVSKESLELVSDASPKFETEKIKDRTHFSDSNSLSDNFYDLAGPDICTPNQSILTKNRTTYSISPSEGYLSTNNTYSLDSLSQDPDIRYELFPGIKTDKICTTPKKSSKIKIDFLQRLKLMNCESIVSVILSYLKEEDLCNVSCVNKTWKKAVSEDKRANSKKKEFLHQQKLYLTGASKENRLGMRYGPAREHKNAFACVSNTYLVTELVSKTTPERTKFDSFLIEAKGGQAKLLKCPKCSYASKPLEKKTYTCIHCCHKFCSSCQDPIFEDHKCHKPQIPKTLIGSKNSKKNLRRL